MTNSHSAKASRDKDEQWLLEEKYAGVATDEFEADRARLASGEPVAYVIGYQPFLGQKIYLDSHPPLRQGSAGRALIPPYSAKASQGTRPLIPRTETEWWTEQMLANLEDSPPRGGDISKFSFLDLCAGSGAIGCAALAKLPDAQVYFGEIDPAHEATIAKNIRENNLDATRANIRIGDLFEPFGDMQFDIIATNPPYVPSGRELPTSVADYEPAQALYAGEDGLAIIRRIAAELPKHLSPNGEAWIEVDSPTAEAARALFTDQGLTAEIRTDQYGEPRVIRILK